MFFYQTPTLQQRKEELTKEWQREGNLMLSNSKQCEVYFKTLTQITMVEYQTAIREKVSKKDSLDESELRGVSENLSQCSYLVEKKLEAINSRFIEKTLKSLKEFRSKISTLVDAYKENPDNCYANTVRQVDKDHLLDLLADINSAEQRTLDLQASLQNSRLQYKLFFTCAYSVFGLQQSSFQPFFQPEELRNPCLFGLPLEDEALHLPQNQDNSNLNRMNISNFS
jgi:hypothetical protein